MTNYYAIRNKTTGEFCISSSISVNYGWSKCADRHPHFYSSIGIAKRAITDAVNSTKHGYGNQEWKERTKELCLNLEIVEVIPEYKFAIGAVVFQQIFRADKM